ncbi:MAG TPA: hypothetical protein VHZ75_03050 [Solirubrobacteraceae bacterium]|jgi:hypothetical protein|nr:hypothetical protein [Solirubrobacteraceae bacterium]
MDFRRLRGGELLTGAGAIGLAAVLFADWFGGRSGWDTLTVGRVLLVLMVLVALTLVVITVSARAVSMATSAATLTIGVATLTFVYLLYRVGIDEPGPNALVSVDAGAYLGLLCVLVAAAGAWRSLADERTDSTISRQQTERVLAVRGAARPAPPLRDPARGEPPT